MAATKKPPKPTRGPGYGSEFKPRISWATIDGKRYCYDRDLTPALRHVPRELLPPLLEVLDRDIRARHIAWMRATDKASAWLETWVDQAIPLFHQGHSYANIGRRLEAKGLGNHDRIARALARYIVKPKKKSVAP